MPKSTANAKKSASSATPAKNPVEEKAKAASTKLSDTDLNKPHPVSQEQRDKEEDKTKASNKQHSEEEVESEEDEESTEEEIKEIIQSDTEQDPVDGTTQFVTIHWDGVMPIATGIVAKRFQRNTLEDQCEQAQTLLLVSEDGNGARTELDPENWTPFLLAVPGSFRKVRVVYGVSLQQPKEPTDDAHQFILALTGELVPGISYPKAMMLPMKAIQPSTVYYPKGAQFSSKRRDQRLTTATWFTTSKVTKSLDLPFLIPVPPALVYDAFNSDMDAMIIYERWMFMREEVEGDFDTLNQCLRKFLKGQVVAPTAKKPQGRLHMEPFLEEAPTSCNEWKRVQISKLVPASEDTNPSPRMSSRDKSDIGEAVPSSFAREVATVMAEENHRYFQKLERGKESAKTSETTTSNKHLGLAKSCFTLIIIYCGLVPGEEDNIPYIWFDLAENGLFRGDKRSKVRRWMEKNCRYRDSKPKLHTGFLNMIIQREFEDTVSSCLKTAVKGLTPFALPALSDDEVYRINEHERALETATSTTIRDVKEPAITIVIPTDIFGLTRNLKRFANVCFALFGKDCPLFLHVEDLIEDLMVYSDTAIASVTKRTIASILWGVHLQSRYFSAGLMGPDNKFPLIPAFQHMLNCVRNYQPVINGDVPPSLYTSTNNLSSSVGQDSQGAKRKTGGRPTPPEANKRIKIIQNPNYHPLVKAKMQQFRVPGQKLPRVGALCYKSGCTPSELFPGAHNGNLCIKATLYGTCFEKCERDHLKISDEEARAAMEKLRKVINNPGLLSQVNN